MKKYVTSYIYKEAQESPPFDSNNLSDYAHDHDTVVTLEEALAPMIEGDDSLGGLGEQLEDLDDVVTEFVEEHGDEEVSIIPGSEAKESDFKEEEEEEEGDYINDGNLNKFMEYITQIYPTSIPKHDGTTTLGCERAKSWLEKMDREISTAIRKDHDGMLDISALEKVRTNIMSDVAKLSKHINVLKNRFKADGKKKASVDDGGIPSWTNGSGVEVDYSDLRKQAATPNKMFISVPPFERAITGIMINAHVSAGHSIEEVYDYLSKKYAITPREELAIMQICMDSGFHIFKDRGTFSGDKDSKDEQAKFGVDFVKNYFA